MGKFRKIKAKVCPNEKCNKIIPETLSASYLDEWCPECGYGVSEDNKWLVKGYNKK